MRVYTKTADADDVALSTFDYTNYTSMSQSNLIAALKNVEIVDQHRRYQREYNDPHVQCARPYIYGRQRLCLAHAPRKQLELLLRISDLLWSREPSLLGSTCTTLLGASSYLRSHPVWKAHCSGCSWDVDDDQRWKLEPNALRCSGQAIDRSFFRTADRSRSKGQVQRCFSLSASRPHHRLFPTAFLTQLLHRGMCDCFPSRSYLNLLVWMGDSVRHGNIDQANVYYRPLNDFAPVHFHFDPEANWAVARLWTSPLHKIKGWTVYEFHTTSQFVLTSSADLLGDVLWLGGGGAGGGGIYGGGGGAGGFRCLHDWRIISGWNDGTVVVGTGAPEVAGASAWSLPAMPSSFGGIMVLGGGNGGRNGGALTYSATNGGSGGGANGTDISDPDPESEQISYGQKGLALGGFSGGEAHIASASDDIWEQGHDGGQGSNTGAWYWHSTGGGGGAGWPAYGYGCGKNGGLGRPCDIMGWGDLYPTLGIKIVDWYCGGGGGMERPNNWGYTPGRAGYGGGGEVGEAGTQGTGGGGGGYGWLGSSTPEGEEDGMAPGPAGGDGKVVIRIPRWKEDLVETPFVTGVDESGLPISSDVFCHIRWIPEDQPHLDVCGDESAVIWGWPNQSEYELGHYHRRGWDDITVGF